MRTTGHRTRAGIGAAPHAGAAHGRALLAASLLLGSAALIEAAVVIAPAGSTVQYRVAVALVVLAGTVPVASARPAPAAALVCGAGVTSLAAFDATTVAGVLALLVVAFRVGARGPSWLGPCVGAPVLVAVFAGAGDTAVWVPAVVSAALAPAAAGLGAARRARREDEARRAADDAIADSLVEHTARGERARISRELHDVVAHHISMISVQAETARLTTPAMPEAGARRLSEIGDTARTALVEMRRLLGVLREDTGAAPPERQPQPGLRELNELLDTARAASASSARLILRGAPYRLDAGVELAAYRIVQEALTNARRHAPGAAVDVELDYADDGLHVRVRDNGPGPAPVPATAGHGLLGMRERAASVGGALHAGAGPRGGFVVAAHLPGRPPTTDAPPTAAPANAAAAPTPAAPVPGAATGARG